MHFGEGSCHVIKATLITVKFHNRAYAQRSTSLPLSPPKVLFKPLLPRQNLFMRNSKLSPKRAVLFCKCFLSRKASFLHDIREYYWNHKPKDNKPCLTYIRVSRER